MQRKRLDPNYSNYFVLYDRQNPAGKTASPGVGPEAQSIGSNVSEDGNYFAVVYRTFDDPKPDGSADLAYFDVNGRQLWIKHFENERIGKVVVSPSGAFIAAERRNVSSNECSILLFNKQGSLVLTEHVEPTGNYSMQFDHDEKSIAVGSSRGKLLLLDLTSFTRKWEYSTGNENIGFMDIDVASGFVAAAVTQKDQSKSATLPRSLYVFDSRGNLVLKKTFTNHGFGSGIKESIVRLKKSGAKIIVILPHLIAEFENELAKKER